MSRFEQYLEAVKASVYNELAVDMNVEYVYYFKSKNDKYWSLAWTDNEKGKAFYSLDSWNMKGKTPIYNDGANILSERKVDTSVLVRKEITDSKVKEALTNGDWEKAVSLAK